MNDKFWDLKKSKQMNMINGALKVFALDGYRHASTDGIVTQAGISKGLLFHYFYSKSGLYEFLAEYSSRFALVELNSEMGKVAQFQYFELQRKLCAAEASVMRQYPYMLLFLERARRDSSLENREDILASIDMYSSRRSGLLDGAVLPAAMSAEDVARISDLLDLARLDFTFRLIEMDREDFRAEEYVEEINGNIQFFNKLFA